MVEISIDGHRVFVDDDMENIVSSLNWRVRNIRGKKYVTYCTTKKGKRVHFYLHRYVMNLCKGDGKIVDHINGDSLDNQKANLRLVDCRQNNLNSAKKKSKHGNRFRGISTRSYGIASQIRINGEIKYLGTFQTDVEAAYFYDLASIEYHGEFGRRNFLPLM